MLPLCQPCKHVCAWSWLASTSARGLLLAAVRRRRPEPSAVPVALPLQPAAAGGHRGLLAVWLGAPGSGRLRVFQQRAGAGEVPSCGGACGVPPAQPLLLCLRHRHRLWCMASLQQRHRHPGLAGLAQRGQQRRPRRLLARRRRQHQRARQPAAAALAAPGFSGTAAQAAPGFETCATCRSCCRRRKRAEAQARAA